MATKTFTAKTKGEWVQLSTLINFDFVDGKDYTLQVLGTAKFGDDGKTGILIDSTTPYTYTHKSGVDLYVMTENEDGAVITVSDSASLALATRGGGSGGGSGDAVWGSITGTLSDQTDLQTALNAKQDTLTAGSGIDITNNVISATVSGLTNTATGTNSLTILGTATTAANATNIGVTSGVTGNYSTALGYGAGVTSGAIRAIQIGEGTNNISNTFSVGFGVNNYQLLNGSTGKIPNERLNAFTGATSSVAGSVGAVPAPTTSDVNKYLKGDGTWATVSGGGLPSQTGNSGKFLTTDGTNASWATVSSGGLQNTATGSNSLTILGTATTQSNAINIGVGSKATNSEAIAIGNTSQASGSSSTAIGNSAKATEFGATAVGEASKADNNGTIAIGAIAVADGIQSYQIGWGTNSTDTTLCVGWGVNSNYTLLDGTTGKIPNDRINGVSGSFTSQDGKTVTVTNGVITSIV